MCTSAGEATAGLNNNPAGNEAVVLPECCAGLNNVDYSKVKNRSVRYRARLRVERSHGPVSVFTLVKKLRLRRLLRGDAASCRSCRLKNIRQVPFQNKSMFMILQANQEGRSDRFRQRLITCLCSCFLCFRCRVVLWKLSVSYKPC